MHKLWVFGKNKFGNGHSTDVVYLPLNKIIQKGV